MINSLKLMLMAVVSVLILGACGGDSKPAQPGAAQGEKAPMGSTPASTMPAEPDMTEPAMPKAAETATAKADQMAAEAERKAEEMKAAEQAAMEQKAMAAEQAARTAEKAREQLQRDQAAAMAKKDMSKAHSAMAGGAGTYRVVWGDTLSRIASKHNVSVQDLAALNNIDDPRKIREGQVLKIPQ